MVIFYFQEYLKQLDILHEEWLNSLSHPKEPRVIQIDANRDKEEMETIFEELAPVILGTKTFELTTKKESELNSRWIRLKNCNEFTGTTVPFSQSCK